MLFDLGDAQVDLAAEDVVAAARSLDIGDGTRSEVLVEDRPVEAVAVVAVAANVPVEKVATRAALQLLRTLGFPIVDESTRDLRPLPDAMLPEPVHRPDARTSGYPSRSLRRLQGQWVALRADQILAHDPDLSALMSELHDEESKIVWVPRPTRRSQ